jgi:hypothetical protein
VVPAGLHGIGSYRQQDPSALGPAVSKTHQTALGHAPNRTQYYNCFSFLLFIIFQNGKEKLLLLLLLNLKKNIITIKKKQ